MGKSAIRNCYYIVEDFQANANTPAEQLALTTAKSQIQVHARFFLKETHKMAETIDFLATVTNVIKSLHARTDLYMIPSQYISRTTYPALQSKLRTIPGDERSISNSKKEFLIGFEVFQQLNDKTKSQTIREKWGRMILSIRGMSVEKASVVLDEWDTPRSLWEELKAHEDTQVVEEEDDGKKKAKKKVRGKDMFFADKHNGDFRKNIGDALSRTVSVFGLIRGMSLIKS
jgi:crossover junction endonuclease MUS81